VKLSFKEDRLVMPIDKPTGKVLDTILAPATLRFRAQRLLGKDDSFIQVRTLDGYIINPNDNIEDVVEQNDHLVLVNRETWIKDFKTQTDLTYWFGLKNYDYKASLNRSVAVSYTASKGAICISLKKSEETVGMEVFDRDILTSYGKDGDVLVMHEAGSQDGESYEQSVYFVVKNAKVTAVRIHLKTLSCPQTAISEWPITILDSELTHGNEKEVQRNWPKAPTKEYELPKTVRTGKLLECETPAPLRDLVADPNVSIGDSPLIYTQTSRVCPEKYSSYDGVSQHFRVEFSVTNNSELDTNIARVSAEYQLADGSWKSAPHVSRGGRQNDYTWRTGEAADDPMRIHARDIVKFAMAIRLDLPIQNTLSNRSYSVDTSLPVPFNIRFVFTDQDGKTAAIAVQCNRRGLELPTFESIVAKDRKDCKKYFFVDDLTTGERFGAYYVVGERENYVRIAPESSYYTVDSANLHTHTIKAVEQKATEWEITSYTSGSYIGSIHLLIDLEAKYAYGVRIRLATPDGSLDESFLLPKDKW
jgi:hypothetical protein